MIKIIGYERDLTDKSFDRNCEQIGENTFSTSFVEMLVVVAVVWCVMRQSCDVMSRKQREV